MLDGLWPPPPTNQKPWPVRSPAWQGFWVSEVVTDRLVLVVTVYAGGASGSSGGFGVAMSAKAGGVGDVPPMVSLLERDAHASHVDVIAHDPVHEVNAELSGRDARCVETVAEADQGIW
jgi:hypothetical protein